MNRTVATCMLGLLFVLYSRSCGAGKFVSLFDGKTLDGWTVLPGGEWVVKDGTMETVSGNLMTRRGFSDCRRQADKMPIYLQYHGDRLQFRNIWVVERKPLD